MEQMMAIFRGLNGEQRKKTLEDLKRLHEDLLKQERIAYLKNLPLIKLLQTISTIAHSIGRLRRQLKGTSMYHFESDQEWKRIITVRLVTILKAIYPNNKLLDRGKFTDFIDQLTEDTMTVPDAIKDQLVDIGLDCRRLEHAYIGMVQEWRKTCPSPTTLRVFYSWSEVGCRYGSDDDLDCIIAYSCKGFNKEADNMISHSYGCENEDEDWKLTRKECSQLGVEYPARLQGLHH